MNVIVPADVAVCLTCGCVLTHSRRLDDVDEATRARHARLCDYCLGTYASVPARRRMLLDEALETAEKMQPRGRA